MKDKIYIAKNSQPAKEYGYDELVKKMTKAIKKRRDKEASFIATNEELARAALEAIL
jgi:hypothetical protein